MLSRAFDNVKPSSYKYLFYQEYIYTAMATIFCFTAFVAQIADLSSFETSNYAHRWSSQLVAGVSTIITYTYIPIYIYMYINFYKIYLVL